jgi:hypothetical protein
MVHAAYATSLLQLQALCIQRGIEISIDLLGNESLVQRGRNILQARFLKSRATHLLFIDADIAFSASAVVDRLLPADKDIITGVYAKKSIDWNKVKDAVAAKETQADEPIESVGLDYNMNISPGENPVVDGTCEVLDSATGFFLVKRHVLEEMWKAYADELWCKNDIQGGTGVDSYIAVFDCMIDPDSRRYLSEDYAFCRRWQQLGGRVHADISFPLSHIGGHAFVGDVRQRFSWTYMD